MVTNRQITLQQIYTQVAEGQTANKKMVFFKKKYQKVVFAKKVQDNDPPNTLRYIICTIFPASSYPHSKCSPNGVTALIYVNDNKITDFQIRANNCEEIFL